MASSGQPVSPPPTTPLGPPPPEVRAPRERVRLLALLLLAGMGWGAAISFTKLATTGGDHPLTLLFWQVVILTVVLAALLALVRARLPLSRRHLMFYCIAGLLGTTFPNAMSYWAAPHVPAGIIAIVFSLSPLMTFALALLIRMEQWDPVRLCGVLLGLSAIAVLVLPETALPDPAIAAWISVFVVVALSYAGEDVYAATAMPVEDSPLSLLLGMSLATLIMITPFILAAGIPIAFFRSGAPHEVALLGASLLHLVAYASLLYLIRHAGAVFASQISYVVTLAGVFWGMVVFDEVPSVWAWLALVLALAGLTLARPRGRTESVPTTGQ